MLASSFIIMPARKAFETARAVFERARGVEQKVRGVFERVRRVFEKAVAVFEKMQEAKEKNLIVKINLGWVVGRICVIEIRAFESILLIFAPK